MPSRDGYCPVAKSVELFGDRWCLLIVREMLRGVRRFNELERCVPGISRSILAQRLRHLERTGVVERTADPDGRSVEYRLTEAGFELGSVVGAFNDWGARWLVPRSTAPALDPDGLMLWIRRHVVLDVLPPGRTVVGFELRQRRPRFYWLLLERDEVSLCPEDPGFAEDVRITADPAALYGVFAGRDSLTDAIHEGSVRLDGPRAMVAALPGWFRLRTAEIAGTGA